VGPPAGAHALSEQVRDCGQPVGFAGHAPYCVVIGLGVWTQGGGGGKAQLFNSLHRVVVVDHAPHVAEPVGAAHVALRVSTSWNV